MVDYWLMFICIDHKLLATNFVQEFNRNTRREYGRGTIDVLQKWQKTNFTDILEPARQAFGGEHKYK